VIYFDGPGGTQVVQGAIDAVLSYFENGGSNLGGNFPTSFETEQIMKDARLAIADFVGADPEEVAFGANTTTLMFSIAHALSKNWEVGDEIVVTELDHRANVDPWIINAEDKGLTVKWIKLDTDKLILQLDDLDKIITKKTRIVAIGHASNGVGTINNLQMISKRAKQVGAIVVVDAVHSAPHILIDRETIGADILLCSAYKFFAPHIGIAIIRREVFEELNPYKVISSPVYVPDKLETGTQNFAGIAGVTAAIDFIASLGTGSTRRTQIISAFERIGKYEDQLADKIRKFLTDLPEITLLQAPENILKTPTIAFRIQGKTPKEICEYLSENYSIFAGNGHFYAQTIADILGINETGSWVRVGMAPYSTEDEVNRFIEAITALVS
jgi:cysteine desulfurase family protein (TIGR01976 family)